MNLVIFFISRLYHLLQMPPFIDETIYIRWLNTIHQTKDFLFPLKEYGWEPLNIWVAYFFDLIIKNPLVSLRLTAVFFGLLTLVVLSLTFRKSRLVLLPYLLSPIILLHDRLGLRGDSAINFCFALCLYGLSLRLIKKKTQASYLIALSIILGFLIKTTAIVLPIIVVVSFLSFKAKPKLTDFKALLLTSLPFVFYYFTHTLNLVLNKSNTFASLDNFLPQTQANFLQLFSWLPQYLTWPVFLLAILGAYYLFKNNLKLFKLLLISTLVPFLFMGLTASFLFPRYILISYLALSLFAGFGLIKLKNPLALILLIPSLIFSFQTINDIKAAPLPEIERWQYVTGWPSGYGLAELTTYLKTDPPAVLVTEDNDLIKTGIPYLWPDHPFIITQTATPAAYYVSNINNQLPEGLSGRLLKEFPRPENKSALRLWQLD